MDAALCESLDRFYRGESHDLYWTDSSWFSWAIPEKDICGLVWMHFRPNMNCICGGPAMWDLSGQHVWEFPYFDFQTMRRLPEGRYGIDYDKYDFTAPWSLSVKMIRPLETYRIFYDRAGFRLDLEFNAVAPPNIMNRPSAEQLKSAFKLHFEQPGRICGFVELDNVRHDVDTFSIRDGGHGPRFMETSPPGGYAWSTADAKTGFHVLAPGSGDGPLSRVTGGYLLRDGLMSPTVDGVRRVVKRMGPRPEVVEIQLKDERGRELHAVGHAKVPAEFMLFPERGQWWTLFSWDYDGVTGAPGEDQEYYGIHEFRKWHRAGPEKWAKR
jgi:hypothetical protein